ncbi:MAG TPA: Holliday junction resolvase RuvX [Tenuifilaceae bacterium]|nr:Holliday junction resolvase RuvX [Tenuifilaceae bacterium]
MVRILALDIGRKRTGIAVTDSLKLIANGLTTIATNDIIGYLSDYPYICEVELFVVGMPRQMNNEPSEAVKYIEPVINRLKKVFPAIPIHLYDERFTSKIAHQTMISGGLKKKERQNKALVDTISATLILQSYLESIELKQRNA